MMGSLVYMMLQSPFKIDSSVVRTRMKTNVFAYPSIRGHQCHILLADERFSFIVSLKYRVFLSINIKQITCTGKWLNAFSGLSMTIIMTTNRRF